MADFAAAQKRILERRAARELALNAADAQYRQDRVHDLVRLPPAIRPAAFSLLSFTDSVRSPYGTDPAFRVGQVDADLLDESLLDLLKKQAGDGLKLFGAHLKDDWDAEITAALRTILWKLSIWDHGASYGASLQGLKYVSARGKLGSSEVQKDATKPQRVVYGLVTIGGRYCWTKWEDYLSSIESGYEEPSPLMRHLSRLSSTLDTTHGIAAFVSYLAFLYNGKYRTLTDRLLSLRLVPASNQTSREVSFEFLNRELVWHAFTEFLLFLLPLVGISRWRRWIGRAWKKIQAAYKRVQTGSFANGGDDDDVPKGELGFLPERTCAICYQEQNPTGAQSEQDIISRSAAAANSGIAGSATTDITNPYQAEPCSCIYCFVCLAQRIDAEQGEGWICLRCGETVKSCRPWNGDVIESFARAVQAAPSSRPPSRRKSVMFDLEDQEQAFEPSEGTLEDMDPMPIEDNDDSFGWSRVGDFDDDDDDEAAAP